MTQVLYIYIRTGIKMFYYKKKLKINLCPYIRRFYVALRFHYIFINLLNSDVTSKTPPKK